jgi:hypothetical protein
VTAKKAGKKSGPKSGNGQLVPQAHGGAIRRGSLPGNTPGTGAPPSLLRDKLRGSFAERTHIIEQIADGVPMQRAVFPLAAILQHASCPKCGDKLKPNDVTALLVEIQGQISASPKDRLGALDLAAKYGLGTVKEISVDNVRDRVSQTLSVIRSHCSVEQAATIINALRPVWA